MSKVLGLTYFNKFNMINMSVLTNCSDVSFINVSL